MLWLIQHSQPDMKLATSYHFTQVKCPYELDWIKLNHYLMQYLWKIRFLLLVISITQDRVTIYIDRAHTVHADSKGHSGLYTRKERGAMINVSKKLGIVTNSSTEI